MMKQANNAREFKRMNWGYIEQMGPGRRAPTAYYQNRGLFRKEAARLSLALITIVNNVKPETRFLLKNCA